MMNWVKVTEERLGKAHGANEWKRLEKGICRAYQ